MDENISFFIDDSKTESNSTLASYDLDNEDFLLNSCYENNDIEYSKMMDYDMNYNVNQLLVICEYYDLVKTYKLKKCNKQTIIRVLVDFEEDIKNYEIVSKRKLFWYYINELKNDKFMKKYILW